MTIATTERETVWYTRCPIPTASSIAISRELLTREFAPEIDVKSLSAASPTNHGSHFDHSLEGSFRDGGNIPAIWARSRGASTTVIGLSWIAQYDALVSLPAAGIATAHDLAGRRIGVPVRINDAIDFTRGSAWAVIDRALRWAGLDHDDVELVQLPVDETYLGEVDTTPGGQLFPASTLWRLHAAEVFALIRGEVDVIYLRGVHGAQLRALLGGVEVTGPPAWSVDEEGTNNSTPATLTVSTGLLRARPDVVDRYVATLLRAARWAVANADRATALIAEEIGGGRTWIERAYAPDLLQRLEPRLTPALIGALERQKDLLRAAGLVSEDVSVSDWVDPGPLERARRRLESEA